MNLNSENLAAERHATTAGQFVTYQVKGVTADMSFLEMLDVFNEELIGRGEEPVAFDHDCREGICGSCGFLIDGVPHGPRRHTTVCQLHMRFFKDGDSRDPRALACQGLPGGQGPGGRSLGVRPHHPGRRLHLRADRQRPRRPGDPGPEGGRGHGHGRRRVHRLRGVRGGLPQRVGDAVHRGQGSPT